MSDVLKRLQALCGQLDDIEPLSPTATPTTRQRRLALWTTLYQYGGQMLTHLSS